MDRIKTITRHSEVSEKAIEKYLCELVSSLGGVCLKYSNPNMVGYPDRVALLPNGRCVWFELKSKGKHTTKVQNLRIEQLAKIGHAVYVCDSKEEVRSVLQEMNFEI